jgi:hypothetical protein
MVSLYELIADTHSALAAKTKHQSSKAQLKQLAEQWHSVNVDQDHEAVRRAFALFKPVVEATPAAKPTGRRGGRPKKRQS